MNGSDLPHVEFTLVAERPSTGPVQYKGDDLEAERGPGSAASASSSDCSCSSSADAPERGVALAGVVSAVLLFAVLILLLFAGQTVIFLLRLVAADRRGRRRPLASDTKTVGELEDEGGTDAFEPTDEPDGPRATIGATSRPIGVCPGGSNTPCRSSRPTSPCVAGATRSSSSS